MTAAITLRIPHARRYHGIARLVVGGLAARLDLVYEELEDLQLALATVLEGSDYVVGPDVTVELKVRDNTLDVAIGPVDGEGLRGLLEREAGDALDVGRLLAAVVEAAAVERRADGDWLRLEKNVHIGQRVR